jgi:hypothetical protein
MRERWIKGSLAAVATLALMQYGPSLLFIDEDGSGASPRLSPSTIETVNKTAACAQAEPIYPSLNVSSFVDGEKDQIVSWLADAVKIPTEMFDVMGPIGEDARWDIFYKFAECELLRVFLFADIQTSRRRSPSSTSTWSARASPRTHSCSSGRAVTRASSRSS